MHSLYIYILYLKLNLLLNFVMKKKRSEQKIEIEI